MEKLLIIAVAICAFALSVLCFYHYWASRPDSILIIMGFMFFGVGIWAHFIQKDIKFFGNE